MSEAQKQKERNMRKFTFRGIVLDDLLKLSNEKLYELFRARLRRKFRHGVGRNFTSFIKKIRVAKKNCVPGEKPKAVKTHMRTAVVVPEMVGAVVGVYNGKSFNNVEVKFDMIGKYLGEFSITYKPTKHGKPGVGATKGSVHSATT